MEDIKISPIFYMGNKRKLVKRGLTKLFPKNIHTFVDVFGGSGVVSMNTKAQKYVINDIDSNIISLYNLFRQYDFDYIVEYVEKTIKEFDLPTFSTNKNNYKDIERRKEFDINYRKLRGRYNLERNILDFYTLMFFSFSQQFRFNKKNEYNMPRGNGHFTEKNKDYLKNGLDFFKSNVAILNMDYIDIDYNKFTNDDFLYFDPPYLGTTTIYNEKCGWNEQHESKFYEIIKMLNNRNIPFGISNVFHNKGKVNAKLIKFTQENNLNVYHFDKFAYVACGKGNAETKEVFITNYLR